MKIQKYKAKIIGTDSYVIGYVAEIRKHLGKDSYNEETSYIISVTEKSMPKGRYGSFLVEPESIVLHNDLNNFQAWLF